MPAGPNQYIKGYLTTDMTTSPHYRADEKSAAQLMHMRMDSRGSPLRRTFIGNIDQFAQGQIIKDKKDAKVAHVRHMLDRK